MSKVTTEIKAVVYDMPPEQQKKFEECVQQLEGLVQANGAEGILALAFVGAKISED